MPGTRTVLAPGMPSAKASAWGGGKIGSASATITNVGTLMAVKAGGSLRCSLTRWWLADFAQSRARAKCRWARSRAAPSSKGKLPPFMSSYTCTSASTRSSSVPRGSFVISSERARNDASGGGRSRRPGAVVDIRVSERTRSGWIAASHWAITPPIDAPTTCADSTDRPSSTAAASSTRSTIEYGLWSKSTESDSPVSRWSYRITCRPPATSRSTSTEGQPMPWLSAPAMSNTVGSAGSPIRSTHSRNLPEITKAIRRG